MSFQMCIGAVFLLALVAGMDGGGNSKTKKTFWSKRDIGRPGRQHDINNIQEINPSSSSSPSTNKQRQVKRANANTNEKGFPVLPFSTLIRKPMGKNRASHGFYINFLFSS